MRRWRLRLGSDRGAVSLSLAIVFPAVLAMVLLVVQASLWWYASQAALTAAREGAEAGRARGGTDKDAKARAQRFLDQLGDLAKPAGSAPLDSSKSTADRYQLTVTVRPLAVLPGLDRLLITQHVELPKEKFVPQGAP